MKQLILQNFYLKSKGNNKSASDGSFAFWQQMAIKDFSCADTHCWKANFEACFVPLKTPVKICSENHFSQPMKPRVISSSS